MKSILKLIIVLFSISLNCSAEIKIREGIIQNSKNFPLIVKISSRAGTCTGTRISAKYVLSAAHCFREKFKKFKVTYFVNGKMRTKSILKRKVIIKSTDISHELAIIPLDEPLGNTKTYPLSSYYKDNYNSQDSFIILGYGYNENGRLGKLRMGKMSFLRNYKANDLEYPMLMLKADNQNNITCPGDSGGPLLKEDQEGNLKLVGIVSFVYYSSGLIADLTDKKRCQKADRAAYISLGLHSNFLEPFL